MNGGDFVFEKVGVLKVARAPIHHFLSQDLAKSHVARPNDLTFHGQRIEGFSTIVGSPDVGAGNQACFNINVHFGDVSGEGVSRRQACRSPFVDSTHRWRTVSTSCDKRTRVGLSLVKGLEV